jgi:hypothetical protein
VSTLNQDATKALTTIRRPPTATPLNFFDFFDLAVVFNSFPSAKLP